MSGKTNLSVEREWFYRERAEIVVDNLQKKRINAQYASDRQVALASVLAMILPGAIVARGDSISVDQIGIISELRKRNKNKVIDPLEREASGSYVIPDEDGRLAAAKEAFFSDVFLVGTNAITLDGKLVNTDGWGNRVAPMVFGPKKVIVVVGVNKIVNNLDLAMERIRQYAAPINAKRHCVTLRLLEYGDLPCVKTGKCVDCNHELSICHYTVIIDGAALPEKGRINVVLVGEELGI